MTPRCARCRDPFEYRRATDRYCRPCEAAVAAQIKADTARRERRVFGVAKSLDVWGPAA